MTQRCLSLPSGINDIIVQHLFLLFSLLFDILCVLWITQPSRPCDLSVSELGSFLCLLNYVTDDSYCKLKKLASVFRRIQDTFYGETLHTQIWILLFTWMIVSEHIRAYVLEDYLWLWLPHITDHRLWSYALENFIAAPHSLLTSLLKLSFKAGHDHLWVRCWDMLEPNIPN
jgi:hypothetical protein